MHRKQLSVFFTLLAAYTLMHLPIRHLLSRSIDGFCHYPDP